MLDLLRAVEDCTSDRIVCNCPQAFISFFINTVPKGFNQVPVLGHERVKGTFWEAMMPCDVFNDSSAFSNLFETFWNMSPIFC